MSAALKLGLMAAVPLLISEYERLGGPGEEDCERARRYAHTLGEKGDILMYGGKSGEAAELFNGLADALAVLSFCPGGVDFLGEHFEGKRGKE